jgi:hypothetical protein
MRTRINKHDLTQRTSSVKRVSTAPQLRQPRQLPAAIR